GDDADRVARRQHRHAFARRAPAVDLQADTYLPCRVGPSQLQGRLADEVALVPFYRPGQASLQRVDLLGQFVAVQRHRRFQPQRVARPEAARLAATLDQLLPQRDTVLRADHDLDTVLAGVAGAAHHRLLAETASRRGVVVRQRRRV